MKRYNELKEYLSSYGKVIVAFSGGIDSYFVLSAAIDALGKRNVLAVTADSPSLKESEKSETARLASQIDSEYLVVNTNEVNNPDYFNNSVNRCFYCKDELYSKLTELKERLGYQTIMDGTNYDDMGDYRPGYKASKIHDVISPLVVLKFTKNEIREISKTLELEIWDKPSSPCLSSRIPYGQMVTIEKLSIIDKAENTVKELGFREFRVRHFEFDSPGDAKTKLKLAKVDISQKDLEKFLNTATLDEINSRLKLLGYDFVTLDMGGLKPGSLNLQMKKKQAEQL